MLAFLKGAFSDGGVPSSSRMLTAIHSLFACGWITHFAIHTHALPDPLTLGALGAFSTVHYAVNRFSQKTPAAAQP